ncbi:MAG: alpha-1,2-fucosyltransferase [Lachnospiraceae bacterium]|nr:alpha-1,2-fucosyltransferase [Lachnospiraceae bacterium]
MKIQFLNGGLANQAFQYIFARYYELSHPDGIMYLDDSYFALNTVHNGYELEKVFGIRAHMLSECFDKAVWDFILGERKTGKSVPQILQENQIQIQMLSEVDGYRQFNPFDGEVHRIPSSQYLPEIQDLPGNFYYHGYWIKRDWFDRYQDHFRKEFTFPQIADAKNQSYMEEIQNTQSVSIHVRRGDYVTLGWSLEPGFYRTCIRTFLESVSGPWHLFVFSDDISWCRAHEEELGFGVFPSVTYVEGNTHGKNYLDLQLMSACKAMFVSNSAFSYLAALLNTKKQYMLNMADRKL